MRTVHTVVVGAGQAGLATSHHLSAHGVDHVVLDGGEPGARWAERRATLRLLTPNWMTRLPGGGYRGPDPHGFMTAPEVAGFLAGHAAAIGAPVERGEVLVVRPHAQGFRVRTADGELRARAVVVATGACPLPRVPAAARHLGPHVVQLSADRYRGPAELPDGAVLVVGAGASGVQVASELRAAGREVVLAVGRHARLPRTYRGQDVHVWLDRLGLLARAPGSAARGEVSPQLLGSPERRDVDLRTLQRAGVRLVGRCEAARGTTLRLGTDLAHDTSVADARLARLLRRIDEHVAAVELAGGAPAAPAPARPVDPVVVGEVPSTLDLAAEGVTAVVWATGYRRRYPWLPLPALDRDGELVHREGATAVPRLHAVGLPPARRRDATLIDGVGEDARHVVEQLVGADRGPAGRRAA